jgi:hypothetical protein
MNTSHTSDCQRRQSLLDELAELISLERGTLGEEYRERPDPKGQGTVRLGPYYKHQCWEKGRNLSRRVPAAEVDQLRQDLHNAQRFDQLTSELSAMAVAESRRRRAALAEGSGPLDQRGHDRKKNSKPRRSRNATKKPKPSSPKSRGASRKKA